MNHSSAHGYTDNELIERFYVEQGGKPHMDADLWFYESDWQMLMPVVEKIESLGFRTSINYTTAGELHGANIYNTDFDTRNITGKSKIECVYKAVLEFIKWYNNRTGCNECKTPHFCNSNIDRPCVINQQSK